MSPFGDMKEVDNPAESDRIWKALADRVRRDILDLLAERPLTTGEIVNRFSDSHCRTAVMKHLEILVNANLVVVRREGRQRWNYLNPVPIQRVCDRWVSRHVKHLASALSRLKDFVEDHETNRQASSKRRASGASKRSG
ncbi:ArsR/SmtB family transcription factor [Rhodopirellula sp. JC639]|uniref:ArsR/SmtB family transcription factor n=1 Tax=Stieleria mannarensis TaxID=2755585 RepID=UPI001C7250DC|nr:helix-turn-helix domain-containing protein [Rhodopirellula sp. JC639]